MTIATLFKVSRPRFWIYVLGPVAIAFAAADFHFSITALIIFLYATLPANLLIYGVNDIFDRETDAVNDKKSSYEHRLQSVDIWYLVFWIVVLNIPFVIALSFLLPLPGLAWLLVFLVTGIGYSAPPIRAKTKPFLDAGFNVLYICLGFATYVTLTQNQPNLVLVLAAGFWCVSMHAYSAIPDISPDTKAGIKTIATVLGARATFIFCAGAYALSTVLSVHFLGVISIIAGTIYVLLIGFSAFQRNNSALMRIYKLFPFINAIIGMTLWFWIALR